MSPYTLRIYNQESERSSLEEIRTSLTLEVSRLKQDMATLAKLATQKDKHVHVLLKEKQRHVEAMDDSLII
jgi:hypothetical protein